MSKLTFRLARRLGLAAVVICFAFATELPASSPQLNIILPRGIQRGHQHVLTFSGARLQETQEVFLYAPGVTIEKLEQVDANNVRVTVAVSPDCRLGEHVAQLRTKTGISEFRSFFVGALAQIDEKEPNNTFAEPQSIELNLTVSGVIQNEDVDYYRVQLKKDQRLNVEIEGIRLGTTMMDPFVAILDKDRFEIVSSDDTPLLKQDGYCSIIAPEDGEYSILVRDASYGGNGNCRYRLHVGEFPRPAVAFPSGGKAGTSQEITYLGDVSGPIKQVVEIPAENGFRPGMFVNDDHGISPSSIPFRIVDMENGFETEPNNDMDHATALDATMALNGIIQNEGDHDWFKITGKKGQTFDVNVFARRISSPLDAVLNIWGPDKKHLVGNDDARGPDSYLRLQMPADGDYWIRVRDHLDRGQSDFVYRVELTPVKPRLTVGIPRVARYSQYRQSIFVPRGNRFATLILASRANFGGEIKLDQDQLPAGVTMHFHPMAANLNLMPVVFEATEDAEISGKLVDLVARHADDNQAISGKYSNLGDFVLGVPNNARYVGCTVDKLPIAVIDPLPFKLEIEQPQTPLVRDGVINIKVKVTRDEGFTKPIRLQFPFRPPGVGTTGSVTIAEGQNEASYPLNANQNAQIRQWPIYVIGSSDVGGAAWASSQLATLNVAERFVTMDMKRAACEQGQETQIVCAINQITEFEGKATAELLGLPANTESPKIEIDKTTKELSFNIKTTAETPPGKHKGVFCRVTVPVNGQPVVATAGRSELQVDKPIVKPAEPAKPVVAPPPKPATAKPLSRLEKLREQARQRKENGK